ncbi:unnamed protein product [Acanthoscelides obtectus]|uniref:BED-type domain-containing protein n=1 Tax=Acanthoscelides obtectus TaxID=200917 RepID=A0A9P0QB20_ACAOB|nr:unnamed protein product [Acanthoscelides obtectus]CAK1641450.1 hypothetical protein AOBTE_LOCUS12411 [Acanthoscelides obtectus]
MDSIKKYFGLAENQPSTLKRGRAVSESEETEELNIPPAKATEKKKSRKQGFSLKWLEDPLFSGWLFKSKDGKAKCICCNIYLSTKKSDLLKHAKTGKHTLNSQNVSNTKTISVLFKQQNITKDVMIADLRYSLLVVAHNFSFNSVKHVVDISKRIFSDSSMSEKVKLSRTKCTLLKMFFHL